MMEQGTHEGVTELASSLPSQRRALLAGVAGLAAGAMMAGGRSAHAGPITPPAGPVVGTGKTLTDVEPRIAINAANTRGDANSTYRITQAGSYYLTSNVAGEVGKHGIEIGANNVTIDLMGFSMIGVAGSLAGISVDSARRHVTVRDGFLESWDGGGIDLTAGGAAEGHRVERVVVRTSGPIGIRVGNVSVVESCVVLSGSGDGIVASGNSIIRDCSVESRGGTGIVASSVCRIFGCSARLNAVSGFAFFTACVFDGCVAEQNVLDGFGGSGVGVACVFSNCTAVGNGGSGFAMHVDCVVRSCSARVNLGYGYTAALNFHISDCSATFNKLDGIRAGSGRAVVLNNHCGSNGNGGSGAGILVMGTDSRIEGNNCIGNTRGIDVDSGGCIILRNTCSGNSTNYDIVANNRYGAIVNIEASGGAAVSGSSAASNLTTTDPWANFTY